MKKLLKHVEKKYSRYRRVFAAVLGVVFIDTLVAAPHGSVANQPLAIVGVNVVNPDGFPLIADATVIIHGDEIHTVGARQTVTVPQDAKVLDARGKWLIPGLMDLHVHFSGNPSLSGAYEGGLPAGGLVAPQHSVEQSFAAFARSGITTVRCPGEEEWAYIGPYALRERAARNARAPRIILGTPAFYPRFNGPDFTRVTSSRNATAKLRDYSARFQPDFLKVWWVDGRFTGEPEAAGTWRKLNPIVSALFAEAKRTNLPIWVDAIELDKAKAVMQMGGHLVHGVFFGDVDDEFIRLMKQHQTRSTWTLMASARYFGAVAGQIRYTTPEILHASPNDIAQVLDLRASPQADQLLIPAGGSRFDGMSLKKAMTAPVYTDEISVAIENLRRVHAAGLAVGLGTDAGVPGIPFGASLFAEFEHYRAAGMSARQILTSATLNNARLLDKETELGSVTVGKRADLVLLDADPLLDIMNTSKVSGVFRAGRYFSAVDLNTDTPADIVTRLRNAFNNQDAQAMRQLLHDEIVLQHRELGLTLNGAAAVNTWLMKDAGDGQHRGVHSAAATGQLVMQRESWSDGRDYVVRYDVADQRIKAIQVETL